MIANIAVMIIKYTTEKLGINNEIKNPIAMSMILITVTPKLFDKENHALLSLIHI